MALPPEKVRAYRPLLNVLVAELLREFDVEQHEREVSAITDDEEQAEIEAQRVEIEAAP